MAGSSSSARDCVAGPEPSAARGAAADAPLRRRRRGRLTLLAVLLVCVAPVVASYLAYYVFRPQARSNYATLLQPTRALPADLPLRTLDGAVVSPRSLHGQWLLIAVGSGACADACEQRLYLQRQLHAMLGRERDRIDKIWLVDDDLPVPSALRQALADTAALQVLRVPRAALAAWLAPQPGHALEEHLYLVDPMGEWMLRAPPNPDPARLKRDLDRLLRASAGWDRPGHELQP